jgi:hydrogenase maturation protease
MALSAGPLGPPTDALVIGLGNSLRGDDGAGPAVVAALPHLPHVRCLEVHQLLPELADDIARVRRVVFVDASVTTPVVAVRSVKPRSGGVSSHVLSRETLLGLCRDTYGKAPRSAWLVEVPASAFELGAGLSEATRQALTEALARVRSLLEGGRIA